MCLILVAWRTHPDFPLVVAANRDEFRNRPSAPASFWNDIPSVLAGRDLVAGGTWLGISRDGRFAALTNFRDPSRIDPKAPSRGALVADFLAGQQDATDYAHMLEASGARYNGFNILMTDGRCLCWYSNIGNRSRVLSPGIYGVSNDLLDTPWPKVRDAKSALGVALTALPDDKALFELLRDDRIHPDDQLPRTGVSLELERMLSAAFIVGQDYGTRSSTVVTISSGGRTCLDEREWGDDGIAVLKGSIGHLGCTTNAIHSAGDHSTVVGKVDRIVYENLSAPPLVYFDHRLGRL